MVTPEASVLRKQSSSFELGRPLTVWQDEVKEGGAENQGQS